MILPKVQIDPLTLQPYRAESKASEAGPERPCEFGRLGDKIGP